MTTRNVRSTPTDTTVKEKPKAATNSAPEAPKPMPTDAEMLEFLKAIDAFKRKTSRNFPSWTEALELLYDLGWRKVGPSHRGE
jgi:hypothetical protein